MGFRAAICVCVLAGLLVGGPVLAQQQLERSFQVGDLAYLETDEPAGWLCFDRSVIAERDGRRCYVGTAPGTFKVAALSRANVGEVTAIYTITVGGQVVDPVDPTPNPTPNPPAPTDIPNKRGLGLLAYQQAVAIRDPGTAAKLSNLYLSAALGLEKVAAERGEVSVSAMQSIARQIDEQFVTITGGRAEWIAWRGAVHGKINEQQNANNPPGWTGKDWIESTREISAALKKVTS